MMREEMAKTVTAILEEMEIMDEGTRILIGEEGRDYGGNPETITVQYDGSTLYDVMHGTYGWTLRNRLEEKLQAAFGSKDLLLHIEEIDHISFSIWPEPDAKEEEETEKPVTIRFTLYGTHKRPIVEVDYGPGTAVPYYEVHHLGPDAMALLHRMQIAQDADRPVVLVDLSMKRRKEIARGG